MPKKRGYDRMVKVMKMSVQYRTRSEETDTIREEMKRAKKKSVYRKLEVVALSAREPFLSHIFPSVQIMYTENDF